MKILHCLKLSLNAFLEMLEKTFCYYDFKKEKETKDDFFKVNPAKTVEEAEEWCKRQLERKCNQITARVAFARKLLKLEYNALSLVDGGVCGSVDSATSYKRVLVAGRILNIN